MAPIGPRVACMQANQGSNFRARVQPRLFRVSFLHVRLQWVAKEGLDTVCQAYTSPECSAALSPISTFQPKKSSWAQNRGRLCSCAISDARTELLVLKRSFCTQAWPNRPTGCLHASKSRFEFPSKGSAKAVLSLVFARQAAMGCKGRVGHCLPSL